MEVEVEICRTEMETKFSTRKQKTNETMLSGGKDMEIELSVSTMDLCLLCIPTTKEHKISHVWPNF